MLVRLALAPKAVEVVAVVVGVAGDAAVEDEVEVEVEVAGGASDKRHLAQQSHSRTSLSSVFAVAFTYQNACLCS